MPCLVVALWAAALSACGGGESQDSHGPTKASSGGSLPRVETVGDEEFYARLERLKGTPLLINFWAMWCSPCVAEMPVLTEVAKDFDAAGGKVIAVSMELMDPRHNLDGMANKTFDFLKEKGFDLEVWLHTTGEPQSIADWAKLQAMALPTTLAINREGDVVGSHTGRLDRSGFDELVKAALGQ